MPVKCYPRFSNGWCEGRTKLRQVLLQKHEVLRTGFGDHAVRKHRLLNGILYSKAGGFQLKMSAFRSTVHRLHRQICGGRSRNHWRRLTKNDEVSFRTSVVGYASPMAWLLWERNEHQQLLAFLVFQQMSWTGSIANLYTLHCIIYNWKYKCITIALRKLFITVTQLHLIFNEIVNLQPKHPFWGP